jgi:catechol 2,3-dioxygenase-like lactoylglutathione lyase family enzyme
MGNTEPAAASRRAGFTGVHSLNRFVFTVPSLGEAERFYSTFGLDVRRNGDALELRTFGNPHCWAAVHAGAASQRLQYLSFGIFPEDLPVFEERVARSGIGCTPHPLSSGQGLWLRDVDGLPLQLVVTPKLSPERKVPPAPTAPALPGKPSAPARGAVAQVRPQRLSHVLRFSPDVPRMVCFCSDVLGMRLSDHSADVIAFLHALHGSDHHIMAFAKSHAPGLHHSSWVVDSLDEVGCGAEQMRTHGYTEGWGVGRHVLGSNYFYYVRDPWKSWAEYSFDIDFVPADLDWSAVDHPAEDSIYVWGPPLHPEFIVNCETLPP